MPEAQKVVFGSCQERKLFPDDFTPDRLGMEMTRRKEPHVGPGSYDNHKFGTIVYNLQKTPGSKRGYSLRARTAPRFPPASKSVVPSSWQYQPDQSRSRIPLPAKTPFNSTTRRFKRTPSTADENPGPGTYDVQNVVTNRKVSWPMCLGRPDWSKVPRLDKRSLLVKLNREQKHHKLRNTVAYMSLYY